MTTTTKPPKTAPSEFAIQVLFREARQRRQRRWAIGIALLAVVATVVALLVSSSPKTTHPSGHVGLARWTPPRGTREPRRSSWPVTGREASACIRRTVAISSAP